MKLDEKYSYITVCPNTGERLYRDEVYENKGVCASCGHVDGYNISHYTTISGRWNRPSLFERWFQGKRTEFLRKEDEDKVWRALKENG